MQDKGFGVPKERAQGERGKGERPTREEMARKREAFEAAAKDCGLAARSQKRQGPGGAGSPERRGGHGPTDEQRSCLTEKGFAAPKLGERGERPTREQMREQREQRSAAAEACGLRGPKGPRATPQQMPAALHG